MESHQTKIDFFPPPTPIRPQPQLSTPKTTGNKKEVQGEIIFSRNIGLQGIRETGPVPSRKLKS